MRVHRLHTIVQSVDAHILGSCTGHDNSEKKK